MEQNLCFHCFQSKPEPAGVCPHCGYDPVQDVGKYPLALPFETVLGGRYILGRVLGQGGFGITYVAMDYQTKARVAVKEFFPDSLATRTNHMVTAFSGQRMESFVYGKQCFLEEAETLAQFIGNPNIIRVYSYFEENNTAYFVMEYVEGQSLQDYTKARGGRIPWAEAKQLLLPAMYALESVHAKGIIHRDVTPDNIFITRDGAVKLLDFGAARYSLGDKSRSLDVVLKHGFAPKEQYTRRGRQGTYTDIYSLAASLYFVTTGRIPPDSIDRMDEDDLIPPNRLGVAISAEDEDVLLKALAVQPAERYQTMGELIRALQQTDQPVQPEIQPTGMRNYIEFGQPPVSQPAEPPVSQPAEPPVSQPAELPVSQPAEPPVSQPAELPVSQHLPQPIQQDPPQKKNAWKIILPLAGLSAVLVIATGIYLTGQFVKGRSDSVTVPENTDVQTFVQNTAPPETAAPVPEKQLVLDTQSSTENIVTGSEAGMTVSLEVGSVERDPATGAVKERIVTEYNDAGQKTREMHYAGDDSVTGWNEYQYAVNGEITSMTTYNADHTVKSKVVFYNDENDPAVQYLMLYDGSDQLTEGYAVKKNEKGQLVCRSNLDAQQNVISTLEHVYDSRGNMVQSTWYDGNHRVTEYVVYRYAYMSDHTEMDEIAYDSTGKGTKTDDHFYDDRDREVEWIWYNDDGTIRLWQKYEYDDADRMTKCTQQAPDGTCQVWTEYHYDRYGSETEALNHFADGHTEYESYYVYEYDNDGNILKMTLSCGSPEQVVYEKEYKVFTVSSTWVKEPEKIIQY